MASSAKNGAEDATVTGLRVYSDGRTAKYKQGLVSSVVALTTLTLYTGWMHVLLALLILSYWSKVALVLLVAIWSTVRASAGFSRLLQHGQPWAAP